MICIVYRSEASIVCTASLLESFQTNTCNKNACNNLTNCHYTQDFFTVRYPIPDDGTQVCAKNKYVEYCRNASGQTVTIPGRFDSTCVNGFVCKDCPSGPGGTLTARESFKHDISPYTRGTIIYLCSNKDANNQQLGSNYQMKYEIINWIDEIKLALDYYKELMLHKDIDKDNNFAYVLNMAIHLYKHNLIDFDEFKVFIDKRNKATLYHLSFLDLEFDHMYDIYMEEFMNACKNRDEDKIRNTTVYLENILKNKNNNKYKKSIVSCITNEYNKLFVSILLESSVGKYSSFPNRVLLKVA